MDSPRILEGDTNILEKISNYVDCKGCVLMRSEEINPLDIYRDNMVTTIYNRAKEISESVVSMPKQRINNWDEKLDAILTSKWFDSLLCFYFLYYFLAYNCRC